MFSSFNWRTISMFEQCRYILVHKTYMCCTCIYLYMHIYLHAHITYGRMTPSSHPIIHFHCSPCLSRVLAYISTVHCACFQSCESLPMLLYTRSESVQLQGALWKIKIILTVTDLKNKWVLLTLKMFLLSPFYIVPDASFS